MKLFNSQIQLHILSGFLEHTTSQRLYLVHKAGIHYLNGQDHQVTSNLSGLCIQVVSPISPSEMMTYVISTKPIESTKSMFLENGEECFRRMSLEHVSGECFWRVLLENVSGECLHIKSLEHFNVSFFFGTFKIIEELNLEMGQTNQNILKVCI